MMPLAMTSLILVSPHPPFVYDAMRDQLNAASGFS
jgi:hypothetical protein